MSVARQSNGNVPDL